jgi:hypothetical protein
MGLWLKCPGCQAQNPLSGKVCPYCGHDLDKLPAAQRVYVIGPAAPPPEPPSETSPDEAVAQPEKAGAKPAEPPSPPAAEETKPAKKPKRTKKKKS